MCRAHTEPGQEEASPRCENQIKVIANNSTVPNSRWYTGSGIYRNVKLIIDIIQHTDS